MAARSRGFGVAFVVAMVGLGVWVASAEDDNYEVGDCLANVPSMPDLDRPLPGRQMMPASDVEEVSCADSSAEMEIVSQTEQTCDTEYAITQDQIEYCLEEISP